MLEKSKLTYESEDAINFDAGYGCGFRYTPRKLSELYVQKDVPTIQEILQSCSYIKGTIHADDLVPGNIVTLDVSKNRHKYFGDDTPFFVVKTVSSENTREKYETSNACLLGPIHEKRLNPRLVSWYTDENNSIVSAKVQKLRKGNCSNVYDLLENVPDKMERSISMYLDNNERRFSIFKVRSRTLIGSRNHINPISDRDLANKFDLKEAVFFNLLVT